MDLARMNSVAHSFVSPLGDSDRAVFFHDGSENTPLMLDETRELMAMTRREWGRIGSELRKKGAYVASDQLFVEAMQPIMMADGAQITGTAEASLWPIQFSTLGAGFLHRAQQHIELASFGVATTPASGATTATLTTRYGTTTGGTALGPSAASATVTISKTNVPWYINGNFQLRSLLAGANSSAVLGGDYVCDQIAIPGLCFGGTVISNVDVTAVGGIWMGMTLGGSASFTMTARGLIVKNVS